jgi:hypothetical protein
MSTTTIETFPRPDSILPGVTTASLLTVILVSTLVGALTGMALHGAVTPLVVAIAAGLVGTITAGVVRNTLLVRAWNAAGVEDLGTPAAVIVSSAVASLAGSLAAFEMVSGIGSLGSGVIGMLAGLLSSAFMATLMVAFRRDRP